MITFNKDCPSPGGDAVPASHPRYEAVEDEVLHKDRWGSVVEGFDIETGKMVSITLVDEEAFGDDVTRDRFWQRAARRVGVGGKGVLRVIEVDPARQWIVTESIRGAWSIEKRRGEVSGRITTEVRDLVEALGRFHEAGYLAASVDPDDLLVGEEGGVRLRVLAPCSVAANEHAAPSPAPPYAAPELLRGEAPTASGDLYSLAVAITACLLKGDLVTAARGRMAFSKKIDWERFALSTRDWVPVQKNVPSLPSALATVINRMIKKKTTDRYADTQQALNGFGGGPIGADQGRAGDAGRGNVVLQQSPLAKGVADQHFKPLNPVEHDPETRIEKMLSPERVLAIVKQPMVALLLLSVVGAFFLLTRRAASTLPRHPVWINVEDGAGKPLTGSTLAVKTAGRLLGMPYLLASDSYKISLPEGSHELTLTLAGYDPVQKSVEAPIDGEEPIRFVLAKQEVVPTPVNVTIRPVTSDDVDNDSRKTFEFVEVDRSGSSGRVLAINSEYELSDLYPGDIRKIVVRRDGYKDLLVTINPEDYGDKRDGDEQVVLQRAPRWLRLQVDQSNTRLWINGKEVGGGQRSTTPLGDLYRVQAPHGEASLSISVISPGFEKLTKVIQLAAGGDDVMQTIELTPVEVEQHPTRLIRTATEGVRVTINGEPAGVAPLMVGLPAGRHEIALRRADGSELRKMVWFHDLRNQVRFDF